MNLEARDLHPEKSQHQNISPQEWAVDAGCMSASWSLEGQVSVQLRETRS